MIAGWTSGPLLTILIAVCSDFLSFIIVPSGFPFFPGYTLSLALAGFIYSLFLYRKSLSILNVFVSRLFVSIFINAFLGKEILPTDVKQCTSSIIEIKNGEEIIRKWLNILNLDIQEAFKLSWDDKYTSLCKEQGITPVKDAIFDENIIMPKA